MGMAIIKYLEEAILILVCSIFLYYYLMHRRSSSCSNKKSFLPTNWPVMGMLPGLLQNAHHIHDFATDVVREAGGVVEFKGPWFTNMDLILVSDPTNIHYILSKNFSNFPKGPQYKKIFDVFGDGILTSEAESWENQRKTAMSLFKHQKFPEFVMTSSWNTVEKGLIPFLDHVSKLGMEIDLQDLFQRWAFDNTSMTVLGHDSDSLSIGSAHSSDQRVMSDAVEAVLNRHMLPESFWKLQRWLQIGLEKNLTRAVETMHQLIDHSISLKHEKLKGQMMEDPKEECLDLLTSYSILKEKIGPTGFSDKLLRDMLFNFMFAGRDTLSSTLTWLFWLLATNPLEENKIRDEIITNLHEKEREKWSHFTIEELNGLIYLHGALCESLRLYPPVPLQHRTSVQTDVLPSGHLIKNDTKIVLSYYAMGRMETIWGKDCLEFKPGRWITKEGRIKREPSFKFTAFNAGPRSCLGKEISFIQLKIVAATIIYHYNIQLVEGHPISPSGAVILHMKYGLKVRITKRCV